MIKFSYKISKNGDFITWRCTWDGKHDQKCFPYADTHPFIYTADYKDDLKLYKSAMKRFREHKKKAIYLSKPVPNGFKKKKWSKNEIEETFNPERSRETGNVVANNPVTLAMCEMLADMKNIHKHSGMTDPYQYWQIMLGNLSTLWD